jgi:hypothetical protein
LNDYNQTATATKGCEIMHYENTLEYKPIRKKPHKCNFTLTIKSDKIYKVIGIIADSLDEATEIAEWYAKQLNAKVCIQQGFTIPNINRATL